MLTIGSRIRNRREELNLSQDELAKRLGYKSRSSINKIELDQRNLTQSKIKAIADALETTPAYIMGWEELDQTVDLKKLQKEVSEAAVTMEMIEKQYGSSTLEAFNLYVQLDIEDRAEIRGENRFIAGDYEGKQVLSTFGMVQIATSLTKGIPINKTTIEGYELITDEHRKSAASGVARGLVGGALLGPVGLLAGGLSAKNKGIYQVAVQFKDGSRSLIEIEDKIYKALISSCF